MASLKDLYGDNNSNNNNENQNKVSDNQGSQSQSLSSFFNEKSNQNNNIDDNKSQPTINVSRQSLYSLFDDKPADSSLSVQNKQELEMNLENKIESEIEHNKKKIKEKKSKTKKENIKNEHPHIDPLEERKITYEDLITTYVGRNFVKIASRPVNFAAMLFNVSYLFYRKKFIWAILAFLFILVLSLYINLPIAYLGVSVICGFSFNYLYMKSVKWKVKKIESKNKNKSRAEIKKKCKWRGGGSIICFLLGIGIQYLAICNLLNLIEANKISINSKSIIFDIADYYYEMKFEKVITYKTNIEINEKIKVKIPKYFEKSKYEGSYQIYYYHKHKKSTNTKYCSIKISEIENINDSSKLMEKISKIYNSKSYKVEIIEKNNITWNLYQFEGLSSKKYYYSSKINDSVYLIEYEVPKSSDTKCELYKEQILNDIKEASSD